MKWLFALIVIAFLFVIGLRRFEHNMLFYPVRFPEGNWDTSMFPGYIEDCTFTTSDGLRLHGWFARKNSDRTGHSKPPQHTLLFLHGNAGNITHRLENVAYLIQLGLQVFIFDYRGYGKSEGRPSENGLYRDALAAYDYVAARKDVDSQSLIIFGRSLGGAVAVELATQRSCYQLILESTFTSARDMARELFGNLPITPLIQSQFDSLTKIRTLHVPLLLIHGTEDEVIPFALGQQLFVAAHGPKVFYPISGAHHNDTYEIGGQEYWARFSQFILKGP